ncbi:MAG: cobyric acid synthase, partial [Deltaproteobacteria bacterium]|nr:cobyric acid synthase [Deltaproteobacteria bacterium]
MSHLARPILLLGTASHAGKSVLTAGLCRVLFQDGVKVCPFKAQNMALNSFITAEGLEMGRAQATQAEAAGLAPEMDMNPILLKPSSETGAQVIIQGLVRANMEAADYHAFKPQARDFIRTSYERLARRFEVIVCEGAGSPAEINLREGDLVNMGLAEMIDAPCLLIGDIDRGGVFASLVGTMELLAPQERARIKGLIINKFRGDASLLKGGIEFLEDRLGLPVLGVIPHLSGLYLPEEDGVAVEPASLPRAPEKAGEGVRVAVIRLPHISNFTDFDALAAEPGLNLVYAHPPGPLPQAEAIILPGTKNTIDDLVWLKERGYAQAIVEHRRRGGLVVGICGGFQMLGRLIADPLQVESRQGSISGLGLLPLKTTMDQDKTIRQVKARPLGPVGRPAEELLGYEIHMGLTEREEGVGPVFILEKEGEELADGAVSDDGRVWGSYLHGLFDNDGFRHWFVKGLFKEKGL